jgi:hypothetical protein
MAEIYHMNIVFIEESLSDDEFMMFKHVSFHEVY